MKKIVLSFALILAIIQISAQTGTIRGRGFNEKNNEPLPFTNIIIFGTTIGSTSDLDGNFIFTGLKPGFVKLAATSVGFESHVSEEFQVTNSKTVFIDIPMRETSIQLEQVVVKASPFRKTEESPVSMRTLGIGDIEKNPGANRDISKVIQALPGVASTVSFRNDIIVRGGGPSENRFYLDGMEIPNLNHFATQGASGGPVGIINVDFIREIDFYSGAFPANRGNALSSVLEMWGYNVTTADSGEAGVIAVGKNGFSCVLMDVLMPGIDGYDACRRIKAMPNRAGTPVVMLTSKSSPFDKIRGKMAGCDAYLTKPVEKARLMEVLAKQVHKK